jgi:hypothetical protein
MKGWIAFGLSTISIGFLIASGCKKVEDRLARAAASPQAPVDPLDGNNNLVTFRHDGHLFVKDKFYPYGVFRHHPGCPCHSKPEKP